MDDDILNSVTPEDMEAIKADLGDNIPSNGDSGEQPEVSSQDTKQVTEEASNEQPTEVTTDKAESTSEGTQPASEGEKTPSEKTIEPPVRRSKTIPYERFLKVVQERNELRDKLPSQTPNSNVPSENTGVDVGTQLDNPMDEYTQEILKETDRKLEQKLKPLIEINKELIKEKIHSIDEKELADALSKHTEATPYIDEIKAYAKIHNTLPYDDILTLVLAKHNAELQNKEKKTAEMESKEADLGGSSNSAARRRTVTPKQLSDEELDKQVEELESKGGISL